MQKRFGEHSVQHPTSQLSPLIPHVTSHLCSYILPRPSQLSPACPAPQRNATKIVIRKPKTTKNQKHNKTKPRTGHMEVSQRLRQNGRRPDACLEAHQSSPRAPKMYPDLKTPQDDVTEPDSATTSRRHRPPGLYNQKMLSSGSLLVSCYGVYCRR